MSANFVFVLLLVAVFVLTIQNRALADRVERLEDEDDFREYLENLEDASGEEIIR